MSHNRSEKSTSKFDIFRRRGAERAFTFRTVEMHSLQIVLFGSNCSIVCDDPEAPISQALTDNPDQGPARTTPFSVAATIVPVVVKMVCAMQNMIVMLFADPVAEHKKSKNEKSPKRTYCILSETKGEF